MKRLFCVALLLARFGFCWEPADYAGMYVADAHLIRMELKERALFASVEGMEFVLIPSEVEGKFSVQNFPGFLIVFHKNEDGTVKDVELTTPYYATYVGMPLSKVDGHAAGDALKS